MRKLIIHVLMKIIGKSRVDHWYRKYKYYSKCNLFSLLCKYYKYKVARGSWESNQPRMFVLGVPTHGNLGDQAIAYAQMEFLQNTYKEYSIIEIDEEKMFDVLFYLKKNIKQEEIIFLHGGGNMGSTYFYQEKVRQLVIKSFPKNRIIVFPQTIDYTDSKRDIRLLNISRRIYNRHGNLVIAAREMKSYLYMKNVYDGAKVVLVPDIVLSLSGERILQTCSERSAEAFAKQDNRTQKRQGVLLCMRGDIEQAVGVEMLQFIKDSLKKKKLSWSRTDTVVDHDVSVAQREAELAGKWSEFRRSSLVITDRLHGMIFSVITGTPCIALNNLNRKVELSYEWLSEIPYLSFVESQEHFTAALDQLLKDEAEYIYQTEIERYAPLLSCIEE